MKSFEEYLNENKEKTITLDKGKHDAISKVDSPFVKHALKAARKNPKGFVFLNVKQKDMEALKKEIENAVDSSKLTGKMKNELRNILIGLE